MSRTRPRALSLKPQVRPDAPDAPNAPDDTMLFANERGYSKSREKMRVNISEEGVSNGGGM